MSDIIFTFDENSLETVESLGNKGVNVAETSVGEKTLYIQDIQEPIQ